MKAEITTEGDLKLYAENETEAWALRSWFAVYSDAPITVKGSISWHDVSNMPLPRKQGSDT